MKKKFFVCLLLCTILCGLFTIGGMAATVVSGTCGENLTWVLDDSGHMLIEGIGQMWGYDYTGDCPWADYRRKIVSVQIADGVTNIGKNAFY